VETKEKLAHFGVYRLKRNRWSLVLNDKVVEVDGYWMAHIGEAIMKEFALSFVNQDEDGMRR
jgi:hypothetical protein